MIVVTVVILGNIFVSLWHVVVTFEKYFCEKNIKKTRNPDQYGILCLLNHNHLLFPLRQSGITTKAFVS